MVNDANGDIADVAWWIKTVAAEDGKWGRGTACSSKDDASGCYSS